MGANALFGVGLIGGLALMISEPNEALLAAVRNESIPVVVLDTEVQTPHVDSVVIDNAVGASDATLHLVAGTPAARCYYVGGPAENFDATERARAFRQQLERLGNKVPDDQVSFGEFSTDHGRAWATDTHRSGRLKGAAIFAGNDEIAFGILQTAAELGLTAPTDFRIVGFDDTRLAALIRPALSSVRVPMAEVGAAAIRSLVQRIAQPGMPRSCVKLPTRLVIRESSRA